MNSAIFDHILELIAKGDVLISEHGYDELADDDRTIGDLLVHVVDGIVIEEYPEYHKGPCVLLLQQSERRDPIHVLWGIPAGATTPAVVITAYRPDVNRWSEDFKRRR